MNAVKQHTKAAERILKRRAMANNNDNTSNDDTPLQSTVILTPTDVTPTGSDGGTSTPPPIHPDQGTLPALESPYEAMTIKQLRKLCDARNPKVSYKKKDTKDMLIAALKDIS